MNKLWIVIIKNAQTKIYTGFLPRDALGIVHIARYCDCMMSVCLSVTFVDLDQDITTLYWHWKSWKLTARTLSPTPSLIRSPKAIHLQWPTPRGTWGNLGETRGGVVKSGVLEHKAAYISETSKGRGKVHGGPIYRVGQKTGALDLL